MKQNYFCLATNKIALDKKYSKSYKEIENV